MVQKSTMDGRLMRWRAHRELLERLPIIALIIGNDGRRLWSNKHAAAIRHCDGISTKPGVRVALATARDGRAVWLRVSVVRVEGGAALVMGEDVTDAIRFGAIGRAIEQLRIDPLSILRVLPTVGD